MEYILLILNTGATEIVICGLVPGLVNYYLQLLFFSELSTEIESV